ncbi:Muconate cycloisomerase 1 [Aureobasidium sp. EXF-12298]|nr:Muconate cycloisomerase 1 [Aureobasidium sp. EXF-12298]
MDFLVGTFYTPKLFTLRFTPSKDISKCKLEIRHTSEAIGGHSWLCLSADKTHLYTTVWASPPAVASYRIEPDHTITFLNSQPVRAMSGYVCSSPTTLYSAGGPTGEVFSLSTDSSIGPLIQNLEFRDQGGNENDGARSGVKHGDFGGLRHGAHSVDLSASGTELFIADIGHNCIWSYNISSTPTTQGKLENRQKWIASRENDGPRHTWPHPNGKILYSVQEHSCYVDALSISDDLISGVRIIPKDKDEKNYWADEVRLSRPASGSPRYLYASTRGLEKETKGYVAVFELDEDDLVRGEAIDIFETATSGGIANAIEPAPMTEGQGVEYLAMTDSQEGYVFMLAFDGKRITEVARTQLTGDDGKTLAAATAVWL